MHFAGRIGVEEDKASGPRRNVLDAVVTPDRTAWTTAVQAAKTMPAVARLWQ